MPERNDRGNRESGKDERRHQTTKYGKKEKEHKSTKTSQRAVPWGLWQSGNGVWGIGFFFGAPAHHQIDVYPFGSGFITSSTSASHEVWPTDI
jgi:hypothetical protein